MKNANLKGLLSLVMIVILFTGCSSPLHTAAMDGDVKKVNKLLDEGTDVNEWSNGTPLFWASYKGELETVKLLVERGANLNMGLRSGYSPLGMAVKENKIDVVKYLIIHGASVDKAINGLNDMVKFCSENAFLSCTEENQKAINDLKSLELQVLWEMAREYNKKGEYNRAADILKRLISKSQHQDYYAFLAYIYMNLKQYEDGIVAVKMSIEIKPNDFAYAALGSIYNAQKQYKDAIVACKKGIELNPKSYAYYELFKIYRDKGDYDNAIAVSNKALEVTSGIGIDLKQSLALLYYQLGRYDEAIANATTAIEKQTFQGIGLTYKIIDDFPVAMEVYNNGPAFKTGIKVGDKIVEVDGESMKGIDNPSERLRGAAGTQVVITVEGKASNKKIAITRGIIIDKNAAKSMGIRSLAYRQKGDFEKAANDAKGAMDLNSSDNNALTAFATSSLDRGEYDVALKYLSLVKEGQYPRLLESIVYAKRGDTEKAIELYKNIIIEETTIQHNVPLEKDRQVLLALLSPTKNEFRNKAEEFEKTGQVKNALSSYADTLLLAPDEKEAKTIRTAIFKLAAKSPSQSEIPEEAHRHIVRGEMLVQEADYKNAVIEFKKALNFAPFSARLYFNIALIEAKMEHYTQAIRYMNIYTEAAPDASDIRAAKDEIIKWEMLAEKAKSSFL